MKIYVKTLNGQTFQFEVRQGDKVGDVKQKLAISQQVGSDQIKLLFQKKPMDNDDNTVSQYDVKEGDTIHMVTDNNSRINVTVEIQPGQPKIFSVDCNEQVDQLKAKIHKETGLRVDLIELSFGAKQIQGGKLMHHSIKNGATLKLSMKRIQVTVTTLDQKKLSMDISHTETVDNFKSRLQGKTGVVPSQQRLICNGQQLNSGRLVDLGCNIVDGSIINMVGRLRGG